MGGGEGPLAAHQAASWHPAVLGSTTRKPVGLGTQSPLLPCALPLVASDSSAAWLRVTGTSGDWCWETSSFISCCH